jgi:hypothetical protein
MSHKYDIDSVFDHESDANVRRLFVSNSLKESSEAQDDLLYVAAGVIVMVILSIIWWL